MIRFRPLYLFLILCFTSFIRTRLSPLPGCPTECGNLTIPFPFGMTSECSFDESFLIICNNSFEPPKPFLRLRSEEVVRISLDGELELLNSSLVGIEGESVSVVVQWTAGNVACHVARRNTSRYACQSLRSQCMDSSAGQGYLCRCLPGYEGNPYLVDGCQDIDHCSVSNPCVGVCINLPGSFKCDCLKGLVGDGWKNGTGCHTQYQINLSAFPIGILITAPLLVTMWIVYVGKERKLEKNRKEFFKKHGGKLLKRKLSRTNPQLTIYTEEDVRRITNKYSDTNVMLGCKPGDFYRGTLSSGSEVAVVMVGRVPQSHIEQFVDQLLFLSQPHRNVVRILGCCLETESPFAVYELHGDGNATLFGCTRSRDPPARFTCEKRVKAAAGVARGLAYMNSHKFKTTFVHGSISSANILMDGSYDPKIFYAAGSNLTTRGTSSQDMYIDPTPLNKKSDVYSFGVVLVELLTGGRTRGGDDRNMAPNFVFLAKNGGLRRILDEEMIGEGDVVREVAELAVSCLHVVPGERPKMKEVSSKLSSLIQMA